ncbi:hypothetical protein S83_058892, partial [Arachis hypogaea]
ASLPGNATFFLTYVALKFFVGYGLELSRLHPKKVQEKFLQEKIKVGGKAGALGDSVTVSREKNKRGL